MSHSKSLPTSAADPNSTFYALIRRNLSTMSGLFLLLLSAAGAAALATWSIKDPSLNTATNGAVHNILGTSGAIAADLMMQVIGLASIIFLFPMALWGWRLIIGQQFIHERRQLSGWILSTFAWAGFLAVLPVPSRWPLPTGLGGLFGDLLLRIPEALIGKQSSWLGILLLATIFLIPAILFLRRAIRINNIAKTNKRRASPQQHRAASTQLQEDDDFDDINDIAFSSTLGALTHWFLSAKAKLKRRAQAPHSVTIHDHSMESFTPHNDNSHHMPQDDVGSLRNRFTLSAFWARLIGHTEEKEPLLQTARIEPRFNDEGMASFPSGMAAKEQSFDSHNAQTESASSRITPQAPRMKMGKRISLEAQPSLLGRNEHFDLPSLHLLKEPKTGSRDPSLSHNILEKNARLLEGVLQDFGVKGEIINVRPGPVVTLYELEPAPGIKSSRVIGLADDIARSMSAISARVAVIPGRNAIGIELPNSSRETVYLRELLASQDYEKSKAKLPMCLGKTIGGEPVIADLTRMPHLLVAGTTGSGKSVSVNTMILSLLYRLTPEQCRLIMVDPKMLELSIYDGIPHLLTPVVTDPKKAVVALKWAVREMEDRYKKMSKLGVRNIEGYNTRLEQAKKKGEVLTRTVQTGFDPETGEAVFEHEELDLEPMPFIVIIVDEMADLMMVAGKDIEGAIQRLAQMARAAGLHLIMATQRPSVDVITGTIKANFPTRISFQVTSKIDSRTILGEQGAEQLLGMGDMLYMAGGGRIKRVHGPFCTDEEVESIVTHLKQQGIPDYLESITEETDEEANAYETLMGGGSGDESNDLYDKAVAIVLRDRKASTSYIQRRLSIGYNRAASIIERMEQEGLVSPANHAGKREILVGGEEENII